TPQSPSRKCCSFVDESIGCSSLCTITILLSDPAGPGLAHGRPAPERTDGFTQWLDVMPPRYMFSTQHERTAPDRMRPGFRHMPGTSARLPRTPTPPRTLASCPRSDRASPLPQPRRDPLVRRRP